MTKNMLPLAATTEELLVDLTFHNVPASLLKEFMLQVVKPYYAGNLTEALKEMMEKAVMDNEFLQNYIKIE